MRSILNLIQKHMEYFHTSEALKVGWEKFKAHFLFLWMTLGATIVVSVIFGIFEDMTKDIAMLSFVIGLASTFFSMIMRLGLTRLYLDLVDKNEEGKLNVLFSYYGLFFRYLGASILFGLMVAGGLILFIVPGIYLGLKYQFFSYLIVDKELGVLDSLKESSQITQGVKWQLFGFSLALIGINILGALAFGIGLLVTIPLTVVAHVFVYRKLSTRLMLVPVTVPLVAAENKG